ncbi:MAG: hypothetical protein LBE13_07010 [Bacteroidales bacterium]|jgi:hypothetical protein|nr:hypothetical protein [Bacteroidales bacterium]
MKCDLKDTTFLFLIRLDSIQRLENLLAVVDYLHQNFETNIHLLEASAYDNGVIKRLTSNKIRYQYLEDKDPILYKTKYYNKMACEAKTPFLGIWDADVIVEHGHIEKSIQFLRTGVADVVYPYNGKALDTGYILRDYYLKKRKINVLKRNKAKMNLLHDKLLYGCGLFIKKEKFIWAGMDNEIYYGWGNEDFDRFYKYETLRLNICRTDNCLYHLSHNRQINSQYRSALFQNISIAELEKTKNSSCDELINKINKYRNCFDLKKAFTSR